MKTSLGNPCVLAIDLGSSGVKAGVIDLDGALLGRAEIGCETIFLPEGGVEQDPEGWWSAAVKASRRALEESQVASARIVAVACTSQWSVTVPVDREGRALMNAVHWMDQRGAPYNQALTRGFPSVEGYHLPKLIRWLRLAGAPPMHNGQDCMGHMLFLKHERPEIYDQTYKFLEPMDYLNLRLTGECKATQNTSVATMLVDNRTLHADDYHPGLLKVSGLDRDKLPDLAPTASVLGPLTSQAAEVLGLTTDAMVIAGTTDNSSSAIGAGAVRDYDPVAVLGTSGYLALHVPFKKTDIVHMIATIPSALPERYLLFSDTGNTGRVLDSYLNNLVFGQDALVDVPPPEDRYARMNTIAREVPAGSHGVLFLPWFSGSLAPAEDAHMRGGFLNLSNTTTRAHLTRAVLEGIAYNWRWLREVAQDLVKQEFREWRLTGGGAQSPVWSQIMADVVGLPMHQQRDPRYNNALGAAFLAFHRLGLLALEDIPGKVQIERTYEPDPEHREVYDRLYAQFRAGFRRNRPIFHALNRSAGSH